MPYDQTQEDELIKRYGGTVQGPPPGAPQQSEADILKQYGITYAEPTPPPGINPDPRAEAALERAPGIPLYQFAPGPPQKELPPLTWDQALITNPPKQIASGLMSMAAGGTHVAANIAQLLDTAAAKIAGLTGTDKGGLFKHIENWAREQQAAQEQQAAELAGGRNDLASQTYRTVTSTLGSIPAYASAAALAAPLGVAGSAVGMGVLGALETADQSPGNMLKAALQNAAMGGAMTVMGPASRPIRLVGTSLMTYLNLIAEGVPQETAIRNALNMGGLAALHPGGLGVRDIAKLPLTSPLVKNTLTPQEQASQDYMTRRGIETPLSMQTGSKAAANLEGTVQNVPGGGAFSERMKASKQKLTEAGRQELGRISEPGTAEQAGAAVKDRLAADLERTRKELAGRVSPQASTAEEAGTAVGGRLATDLETARAGLAGRVSPTPATPESAGQKVLDRGKAVIRAYDQAADESYKAAWQAERDPRNFEDIPTGEVDEAGNAVTESMPLPIDMGPVKAALKPLAARYEYTLRETDARASLGLKAMRNIIEGPRYKPASAAEMDLGMLKEAARTEKGLAELRDPSQGLAAKSVAELQTAIDGKLANAEYPGWDGDGASPALRHLQAGRRATAQKHDVASTYGKFGRNIEELEPVGVYNRMIWQGDSGIEHLRDVAKIAPDAMPEVGRAFIDGGGNWEKLGPETKKILFRDPEVIKGLDKHYADQAKFGPLSSMEPVALFKKLTGGGGTRINLLRDVAQKAPELMPQMGRAFIDAGGEWSALDPETKKVLFKDPKLIKDLDKYYADHAEFAPLEKLEPVALVNRLTAGMGERLSLLRGIAQKAPEQMPKVFRTFVEGLLDRVTREGDLQKVQGALDEWLDMDSESKGILSSKNPALVHDLNDLFFSLKRMARNPNPSGSGFIMALNNMRGRIFTGLGLLGAGIGGAHGGYAEAGMGAGAGTLAGVGGEYASNAALARLLFNQKFIRMFTQGLKMDMAGNEAGAGLAARTIAKLIPEEETPGGKPPEEPPEGGPPAGGGPSSTPPGGAGGTAPGGETPVIKGIESLQEQLQTAGDEAFERVRNSGTFQGRTLPSLFPAEVTKDMVTWGAARIANGAIDFGKWSKTMLADATDISPEAAARVRAMLPQLYKDAQKEYEHHLKTIGAENIADLPTIMEYYRAGKKGKNWYNFVKPALQPLFGENTDLFLRMFAATSPNTKVTQNVLNAVKAYRQFLTGEPFTGMPAHVDNLNRAVAGVKMSGPKVGAFGPNLLGNLTPVTVDLWMARAILGRDTVTPLQSKLVDYMTSQAAKKVGLEPAEMQAAVWTGIKKLRKSRDTSAPPEVIVKEYLDKNPQIRQLFEDSLEMSKEHFKELQSKQEPAKPPRN